MSMPDGFWNSQSVLPIPLLQQLSDWVIQHNERRQPKWKFRFAPDFAMQIQPKLTRAHALLFEGRALQTENVTAKLFTEPKQLRGTNYRRIHFLLLSDDGATWTFKPKLAGGSRNCSANSLVELRARVVEALHPDHFASLQRDRMLSPNCLCCGKGLTDPASMARWVGPECWGSASTNLPRIFNAMAA